MDYSVRKLFKIVGPALFETFFMVFVTLLIAIIFGFILSTLLYISDERGLRPNKFINGIVGLIVNVIRSFPFVILVVALIPLTRAICGTVIGNVAALVPLTISATSLVTRLIESSFREVDRSKVEAVQSFGATTFQIMKEVVLTESIPSIVSNLTVATLSILSMTAAAGAVGAGGLGSVAINYGYASFDDVIMYGTVIVLVIVVQLLQKFGNRLYKATLR